MHILKLLEEDRVTILGAHTQTLGGGQGGNTWSSLKFVKEESGGPWNS